MKSQLDTKDLMEFKFSLMDDDADKGLFRGMASVFGVVDTYGDVVVPGAFRKTLKDTNPVPLLWNHSMNEPIGVVHLSENDSGLVAEGHLNMDVARAAEIRSLMKQGSIKGLSIGYQTVREGRDKELNARLLKEIKLWEVSPVVFQACPGATVASVKDALSEDEPLEPLDIKAGPEKSTDASNTSTPSTAHLLEEIASLRRPQ